MGNSSIGGKCEECGGDIKKLRLSKNSTFAQRYCCTKCRVRAWNRAHPRMNVRGANVLTTAEKPLV